MKKFSAVLLFFAVGILVAFLFSFYQTESEKKQRLVQAGREITSMGRIVLLEQRYRSILAIQNTQQFLGIQFPRNRLLLGVPYRIRYGVDMSKGLMLTPKGRSLIISYPGTKIFDIDVIHQDIETFMGIGKIRTDDFIPLLQDQHDVLRKQLPADYSQIAEKNLLLFLKHFFAPLGYEDIELRKVS